MVIYMIKKAFAVNALFLISSLAIVLYSGRLVHAILLLAAVYLFVAYSSECRGVENIWIFMLIAVGFMPINIALEMQLYEYVSLLAGGPIGKILSVIILYAILFSLEEIIAGLIGRVIWRKQRMDG